MCLASPELLIASEDIPVFKVMDQCGAIIRAIFKSHGVSAFGSRKSGSRFNFSYDLTIKRIR